MCVSYLVSSMCCAVLSAARGGIWCGADLLVKKSLADGARHSAGGRRRGSGLGHGGSTVSDVTCAGDRREL